MKLHNVGSVFFKNYLPRSILIFLASGTIAKPAMGADASGALAASPQTGAELTGANTATAAISSATLSMMPKVIEKADIQIDTPSSWETTTETGGYTLKTQEPDLKETVYGKAVFRRGLTLSVAYGEGSPIDEQRALELRKTIEEQFNQPQYLDFATTEHRILTIENENDAILVYSRYNTNVNNTIIPMIVMHVLRANENNQYLFTYADMEERFSTSSEFTMVYGMILSAKIPGKPIVRNQRELMIGGFLIALLMGLFGLKTIRSRRALKFYESTADEIYGLSSTQSSQKSENFSSSVHTQSMVWALDKKPAVRRSQKSSQHVSHHSLVHSDFF